MHVTPAASASSYVSALAQLASGLFAFTDTAATEISTLSLHDALPICRRAMARAMPTRLRIPPDSSAGYVTSDRKSTRLNSSHTVISYAVFCLKKKKMTTRLRILRVHFPRPLSHTRKHSPPRLGLDPPL